MKVLWITAGVLYGLAGIALWLERALNNGRMEWLVLFIDMKGREETNE